MTLLQTITAGCAALSLFSLAGCESGRGGAASAEVQPLAPTSPGGLRLPNGLFRLPSGWRPDTSDPQVPAMSGPLQDDPTDLATVRIVDIPTHMPAFSAGSNGTVDGQPAITTFGSTVIAATLVVQWAETDSYVLTITLPYVGRFPTISDTQTMLEDQLMLILPGGAGPGDRGATSLRAPSQLFDGISIPSTWMSVGSAYASGLILGDLPLETRIDSIVLPLQGIASDNPDASRVMSPASIIAAHNLNILGHPALERITHDASSVTIVYAWVEAGRERQVRAQGTRPPGADLDAVQRQLQAWMRTRLERMLPSHCPQLAAPRNEEPKAALTC